jgi:hypothetical protein
MSVIDMTILSFDPVLVKTDAKRISLAGDVKIKNVMNVNRL